MVQIQVIGPQPPRSERAEDFRLRLFIIETSSPIFNVGKVLSGMVGKKALGMFWSISALRHKRGVGRTLTTTLPGQ